MSIAIRVLLVLAITALAGGAAYLFSDAQPRKYQSTMRFGYGRQFSIEFQLLGPSFSEPSIEENVKIRTEATVLGSFDIAAATAKAAPDLRLSAGQIAAATQAQPVRDTLTVLLRATASSPERAERITAVYGREYLKFLRRRERKRATKVERALKRQLAALSPIENRGVLGANLRTNVNRMKVLKNAGSGNPEVVEQARASRAPASPNTSRNVVFGVLFGLVVAIGLVALRSESKSRAALSRARRAASRGDGVHTR